VKTWHVTTKCINEYVRASNQFEAWDTLRDRPVSDFGLIVLAEPDESADPIMVHTAALMFSWGRSADAELALATAEQAGLPDTREMDLAFAAQRAHEAQSAGDQESDA
jgi:hypothetical protein